MNPEPLSQITAELFFRNYIFDFATTYFWSHPGLKSPGQFTFTDQDYSDFRDFLLKRRFSYQTNTEESLNDLVASAKREKYYDLHKELFSDLEKDLNHSLEQDLQTFKKEITRTS